MITTATADELLELLRTINRARPTRLGPDAVELPHPDDTAPPEYDFHPPDDEDGDGEAGPDAPDGGDGDG